MATATKQLLFTVTTSSHPSWVDAMAIGAWYEISGPSPDLSLSATQLFEDVDPDPDNSEAYAGNGYSRHFASWNSACVDMAGGTRGMVLHYGGGHENYFGNVITGFDMETRAPSIVRMPSTAGPFTVGAPLTNGAYVDGTPSPPHTYQFLQFHPGTRSLVCLKSINQVGAPSLGGNSSLALPWMYSVTGDAWRRGPQNTSLGADSGGAACYDSIRDVFWMYDRSSGDFASFDPNGDNGNGTFGTWTFFNTSGTYGAEGAMGHDPDTDFLLAMDFSNGNLWRKDPDAMTSARVAVSMSSTPALVSGSSFDWSSNRSGFIVSMAGTGNVYRLSTADNWASATWTLLTTNTNGKSFTVENGLFGKTRVLEYGGTTLLYQARGTGVPVQSMRLS